MEEDAEKMLVQTASLTQKVLGEHISKPVLAEKYLLKPPFRFLHEIVTSVIETTGFMKNVFPLNQLKYDKITNVDDKRAFLKTAIDAIESEANEKCEARPSKILSGKEPDKTNELLQLLAKAITSFKSKHTSKPSGSKGISNKNKVSQKPIDSKTGTKIKPEDAKRARSRPPAKNLATKKSDSQENVKREIAGPEVCSQSKIDSKNGKPGNRGNEEDVSTTKSATQISTTPKKSDESLKTKVSSTTASSPNQSSTAVTSNSKLKQSLLKKSSSSKLLPMDSRKSLKQAEKAKFTGETKSKDVKSSENISKVESATDGMGQRSHSEGNSVESKNDSSSVATLKPNTGMPPETMEEVPAKRPVTRKKPLQNYNGKDDPSGNQCMQDTTTTEDNNLLIPATSEEQVSTTPFTPESTLPATTTTDHDEQKHKISSTSSSCTSSDEGVTEEMTKKISEWKGNPGHVVKADSVEDMDFAAGWIPQSRNNPKTNSSSCESIQVFKSRENCNQQCNFDDDEESMPKRKVKTSTSLHQEVGMKRPITVIFDNQDNDDDDETFLVQEKVQSETDLTLDRLQSVLINTAADIAHIPQEHRGLLVNQIMETQRELEQLSSQKSMFATLQNEMAERDKEALREVYLKQIEDLKGAIQKMAKCANPLANIFQRSQDDACLMEIEFRKLRQENERLQRKIDEARLETTRALFPKTEELAHLDNRIEKMVGAIVLAKQRLHMNDEEYYYDYIRPIVQCPTKDEDQEGDKIPIWKFKEGNSSEEDGDRAKLKTKSMLNVFRRAVSMHENEADVSGIASAPSTTQQHLQLSLQMPVMAMGNDRVQALRKDEGNHVNMGMPMHHYSGNRFQGLGTQPQLHSSSRGYGDFKERPLEKDIKPPWWD